MDITVNEFRNKIMKLINEYNDKLSVSEMQIIISAIYAELQCEGIGSISRKGGESLFNNMNLLGRWRKILEATFGDIRTVMRMG